MAEPAHPEWFIAFAMCAMAMQKLQDVERFVVVVSIHRVGTDSVFKAVYVDRRELKCVCLGGSSRVPLGSYR